MSSLVSVSRVEYREPRGYCAVCTDCSSCMIPDRRKQLADFCESWDSLIKGTLLLLDGLYIIPPAILCTLWGFLHLLAIVSLIYCRIYIFKCFVSISKRQKDASYILLCLVHENEIKKTAVRAEWGLRDQLVQLPHFVDEKYIQLTAGEAENQYLPTPFFSVYHQQITSFSFPPIHFFSIFKIPLAL